MLSIRINESIKTTEDLLSRLDTLSKAQALELSRPVGNLGPGVEAALIQTILTWIANSRARKQTAELVLQLQPKAPIQHLLQETSKSCLGLVSLLASDTIHRLNHEDITRDARRVARDAYNALLPLELTERGNNISLILHDKQLPPIRLTPFMQLAVDEEREDREESFVNLVTVLLDRVFDRCRATPLRRREKRELPDIIYQLFSNAEEWGSTKLNGAPVETPVRGILVRVHDLRQLSVSAATSGPISDYIRELRKSHTTVHHLLEVSLFDAGIGLAQRFARKPFDGTSTIEAEYKTILQCWRVHKTTSSESGRGVGLFGVMRSSTRLNGFIRLRTGRLHLYRNFMAEPHPLAGQELGKATLAKGGDPQFDYLRDWNTSETQPHSAPYSKGSLFTLLFAMKEAQQHLALDE